MRIALVVSHPIQHFCPQYASWAKNNQVTFKVFFASALGYKKYVDPNFGREISWGNLRLNEFDHVFLNGDAVIPSDKNIDAISLEKHLSDFSPDALIIYGYFQKLQRRAHRWAQHTKIPIAYISDSELRHPRSLITSWIKSFFVKHYFSSIDYFLSVGDANEEYYKRYGTLESQFVRMHFPIDIEQYENAYTLQKELSVECRNKYNILSEDIVLSVVGKLVPWKNQDHIIDALSLLEKENVFVHLFIIGSGVEKDKWEQKASRLTKSKVHFTGFVEAHYLPMYYAASDIYVHSAGVEPHSIAISEAIYMGCPIVLSDRCGSYGPTDDVQVDKNGFVYTFGEIKQLADQLKKIISDARLRISFSGHSHAIGVKHQKSAHQGVIDRLIDKVQKRKTN